MSQLKYIQTLGKRAKKAAEDLSDLNEKKKNDVLKTFYSKIKNNSNKIIN